MFKRLSESLGGMPYGWAHRICAQLSLLKANNNNEFVSVVDLEAEVETISGTKGFPTDCEPVGNFM